MFWNVIRGICRYFFPLVVEEFIDMRPERDAFIDCGELLRADRRVRRISTGRIKKWRNRDFRHTWHEYGEGDSFDWGTPRHVVLASIKLAENPRVAKRELDPDEPFWEKSMDTSGYEYGWRDYAKSSSDDEEEEEERYEAHYY